MKKLFYLIFIAAFFVACNSDNSSKEDDKDLTKNPLLMKFDTPYEVPPFDLIKNEHYLPAFEGAMALHNKEIEDIVNKKEEASFENTLEALDASGRKLTLIGNIFSNLLGADTNKEMQDIAKEAFPKLTKHEDNIFLNEKLFLRVKKVYENRENKEYTPEQLTLLTETYKRFARGGADLPKDKQNRLREINEKLSSLTLQFGDNLLAENNKFKLIIENKEDLAGLPQASIGAAAEKAEEDSLEGKWLFTVHKPSLIPFLQFSEKRELREKMFYAYANMCNNNDEFDNKKILSEIINLRLEKAKLFGFKNFADYVLDNRMAKNAENVYELLNKVWDPALKAAKADAEEFQKMIKKEGGNFKLEPWDWRYYAEKLRKEKYKLDNDVISQYFELNNCLEGLFTVVNELYGIKMKERKDIPKYHEDVRVYEVQEADGSLIGILYMDFYTRTSKRSGAWMTDFRKEYKKDGKRNIPIISTCYNFPKPVKETPALLSFTNVTTMYHEFGHCLHGLLANTNYYTLSGTSVKRDFVELPSQIMENWAAEPDVIKMYAKHYKTGEVIPDELIEKLEKSAYFNQGFIAVEYLAACYLDMNWHMITEAKDFDVVNFEKESMEKVNLIKEIIPRYRSTYFAHITGGYATGYYSYIWAEVLDADAFEAFKETSLYDQNTAASFRKNILEKGGTEDQEELYKRFRGAEPKIEPMLKSRGFL